MATLQKSDYEKVKSILAGWKNLRSEKTFAGMTLDQFAERTKPIDTTRDEVTRCDNELTAAINARDTADAAAFALAARVVNAVKADEAEGEDGELYEAMGYVRKSERRTGLSRKAKAVATTAKA